MRILIAHNRYQGRGGEDAVFEQETALLSSAGHDVETLIVHNDTINSVAARIRTTVRVAHNPDGISRMAAAIERFRPDVVHVHNFFPLLSPAVFDLCREMNVPAVVTLHNYRTICAGGMLLRDGNICSKCVTGTNVWGAVHRCYRNSVIGSAASAWMVARHRQRGTWTRSGLRLIALSQFARATFIDAGFVADRIDVKPNFMADPGRPDFLRPRQGILYVGRLSPEKGVDVLLAAAAQAGFPLTIAGDGPELGRLQAISSPNVRFLGHVSRDRVMSELANCIALVVPSLWYEGFPMVVVEAFARGTPVIASRIGSLAEIISHGRNGLLAAPANVNDIVGSVDKLSARDGVATAYGREARDSYAALYAPDVNLPILESIYARAISDHNQ